MPRSPLPLTAALLAATLAGCGGDAGERFSLRTPPVRSSAEPLPEVRAAQERAERLARLRPTRRDALRLRPLLKGWSRALRRNDDERAARYFAVPAVVAQAAAHKLRTAAEVEQFNRGLPCGTRLRAVRQQGRFVVATFVLTKRPLHLCNAPGEKVRIAFVVHKRKIVEWREVPDVPGAAPGPARPEDAPEPPVKTIA